ncbi:type IV secretory system conjugative DNA transfer family protein [Mesomycoplasma hyopneumoniae]|uniref:ICEF-IIA n=1 Tax=Mesomycoplasma hyopneumoniae TaxID=2099 RepID=A0ABD4SX26_MESHO|nr:type IV secretory system conjugative DNA transfer family protein [Mesomycoplasma hyopneumoniae]MCI8283363.1 hypothetical protein [Mesomycoplasma hyopneumoniae]MCI8298295.1 hypothetical protein [Mesomycoplasma hyopneumoniae]
MKLEQLPKVLQKIIIAIISFIAPFIVIFAIWPWIFAKKFNPITNIFLSYSNLIFDWKEILWIVLIAFAFSFIFYFIIHFFEKHNKKLFSKELNKSFMLYDEIEKIGSQEEFRNLFLVQKDKIKNSAKKNKNPNPEKPGWVIKTTNQGKNKAPTFYISANSHAFILGDTRSGKTQKFIIPTIKYNIHIQNPDLRPNLMVVDPKGELFTSLSKEIQNQGYEIVLLDFQNLGKSRGINFLAPIWDKFHQPYQNEAEKLQNYDVASNWLQKSIESIHEWETGGKDNFWSSQAKNILYAVGWYLLLYSNIDKEFTREKYVYANFIYFLSLDSFTNGSWIEVCKKTDDKLLYTFCQETILPFIKINPETLTSILANATNAMVKFNSLGLKMFSSKDETSFDNLVKQSDIEFKDKFNDKIKPFAVFITFQLDSNIGQLMIPSIINNCYSSLITIASSKPNRKNFRPFLFLGDEFGNLPPIWQMATKMSTAASYGVYFGLVLQNIQQLEKYGKESDTILSNSTLKIYFRSNDLKSLETFVKFAGKKEMIKKSYSTPEKTDKTNQGSSSESLTEENIVTVNKLAQMPPEESWIFITGQKPIHIKSDFAYQIWKDPQKSLESFYSDKESNFNFEFIEFKFENSRRLVNENFASPEKKNLFEGKELEKEISQYLEIWNKYFRRINLEKNRINQRFKRIIEELKKLVNSGSGQHQEILISSEKEKLEINFENQLNKDNLFLNQIQKIEKEINSLNSLLNSTNSWIDDSYKNSIKSQIIKKEMIISQLKNKNKESSHE